MTTRKNNSIRVIVVAGLTAAALDIIGAMLVYAIILDITTAQRVLQSVAAGVQGRAAFEGGWTSALLGLALHTFIALCFAAFYYMMYPYFKRIIPDKWLAGVLYGCFVWAVMNLLVLPLNTGKPFVFDTTFFLYGIGLLIFLVGIPISLITEKMRNNP